MKENFNSQGYCDSLATNLEKIRKTDTEEAQDVLEEEEQTIQNRINEYRLKMSSARLLQEKKIQSEREKSLDVAAEITLTIDYAKTPEQVIADGNYALEDPFNIASKNFPISPEMIGKKVEVATKLFHFNRDISSSDEVIAEMDKDGYRPATLMELLALDSLLPALQRQFKIAALGSVWYEDNSASYVPCLYVSDSSSIGDYLNAGNFRRELNRSGSGTVLPWNASSRFLGVHK